MTFDLPQIVHLYPEHSVDVVIVKVDIFDEPKAYNQLGGLEYWTKAEKKKFMENYKKHTPKRKARHRNDVTRQG